MSGPTYFTDRDFGPTSTCEVVRILRKKGIRVECHDDHFPETARDDEWLGVCGARGWVPLTKDTRIQYSPLAQRTIMEADVHLFVMIGRYSHARLARNFVNSLARVETRVRQAQGSFIARLYMAPEERFEAGKSGQVKLWLTEDEWRRSTGQ